jgi:hypothetical protein
MPGDCVRVAFPVPLRYNASLEGDFQKKWDYATYGSRRLDARAL